MVGAITSALVGRAGGAPAGIAREALLLEALPLDAALVLGDAALALNDCQR